MHNTMPLQTGRHSFKRTVAVFFQGPTLIQFCFLLIPLVVVSAVSAQSVPKLPKQLEGRLPMSVRASTVSPQARGYDTLIYDPRFERILMLGGEAVPEPDFSSGLEGNGGVWSFEAGPGRWTAIASSIPNNLDTSVTYDVLAHRIIAFLSFRPDPQSKNVFGPLDFISETWAYDPVTGVWENRHPAQSPPPGLLAGGSQIAYNIRWGKTIMFGGLDLVLFEKYLEGCGPDFSTCDNSLLPLIETNHTWVYDYFANTWTDMAPAVSPASRNSLALTYDLAADRVILFGGGDFFVNYNDTWSYDYQHNTWTELHPATLPVPRAYGYLAYDDEQDRLVLFGGEDFTETVKYGDTWAFNYWDQTWTQRFPSVSPSPRGWFGMSYSPTANSVVIFGGGIDREHFTDETWTYRLGPDKWTQVPKP